MSLITLNIWWLPLFICFNLLPWKCANSPLSVRSFFKTFVAREFPILNSLAITLQLNFLFLASSKISIFSSNVRHHLLRFPDSHFFTLIETILMLTSLPPSMIKTAIDLKHSIKKIRKRIDSIINKRTINLKHLIG